MLARGDKAARHAFRTGLREESTPLPLISTLELDAHDILEVQDVADAIARAEQLVPAPRSSRPRTFDIFEALGKRPTDDAVGPATPAPPRIDTPLPPPLATAPRVVIPPAPPSDDAFYQPAGRVRTLADATLDGGLPPAFLVEAQSRRRRFAVVAVAILVPLAAIALVALLGPVLASAGPRAAATESAVTAAPILAAPAREDLTTEDEVAPADETPAVDVNSLPAAAQ
jgi:hypothetical protein